MHGNRITYKGLSHRMLTALALFGLLLSLGIASPSASQPMIEVIVQGVPGSDLVALVETYSGQVTRDLGVIDAIAARVPADRVDALERALGVTRVWQDDTVQSNDSADPGTLYAPVTGGEAKPAGFDLHKLAACDGDTDNLDQIPVDIPSPYAFQSYTFIPESEPGNPPELVDLRFALREKSLNQARLEVYQASTSTWHPFEVDTLSTNDRMIDVTFDLSQVLATAEDLAEVQVRFYASRNEGGEKAEVDCACLHLVAPDGGSDVVYAPAAGGEAKPAGFDLGKLAAYDSDKDDLDHIAVDVPSPYAFQSYSFAPTVDAENLPGVVDLRFALKEKSLNQARLEVYQASTRTWHPFEIDTLSTNDRMIDATFDLSEILATAEDLADIQVRFYASRNEGGEKAQVNWVSLRLADLIGESTLDPSDGFEAANAQPVWTVGYTGAGVGVVVLDSGVKKYTELEKDTHGSKNGLADGWNALTGKKDGKHDKNGHGTLVASVVSNQKQNDYNKYYGVAPDSSVIPVQVLDEEGRGSYSRVIAGIGWAIEHKDEYNIRVMNLSLSAPVRSWYWDDPLNQAVMRAWQEGIVVVVAAGNGGPGPMTVGVPGNVPYVITVGALTDAHTPGDWSDDYVPAFSAAGPTYEGFVKPDLVAPGGHVVGLMSDKCRLAKDHPHAKLGKDYYRLSGTSMSAAQVSGVVALVLSRSPGLTPDEVKYRLLASARPAATANDTDVPAFSPWQQGAGRVDAFAAVFDDYAGTANLGLDIDADLAGTQHYVGYTRWDAEAEQFYLEGAEGYTWGGGFAWSESYLWGGGFAWSEAYAWNGGFAWSEAYTWGDGFAWSEAFVDGGGFAWSEAAADLVIWVPDE